MTNAFTWVQLFITAASPIILAWFTAQMSKSKKITEMQEAAEKVERDKRDKEIRDSISELTKKLDSISKRVGEIEGVIGSLKGVDERFLRDMRSMAKQYQISTGYSHEIAKLVMVLAAGMRDQHLDGNITKAIESYHDFERRTLSILMTNTGKSETDDET